MFPKHALLSVHAFIRVHLGVRESFHNIHPSSVYTFFQQNPLFWSVNLFQRKAGSYFFPKTCWLLVNQSIFIYLLYYYYYYYYYFFFFFLQSWYLRSHIYFSFLKSRANEGTHGLPTLNHKVNGKNAMISHNEKQWQNKLRAIMSDHSGSKHNNWKQQR